MIKEFAHCYKGQTGHDFDIKKRHIWYAFVSFLLTSVYLRQRYGYLVLECGDEGRREEAGVAFDHVRPMLRRAQVRCPMQRMPGYIYLTFTCYSHSLPLYYELIYLTLAYL